LLLRPRRTDLLRAGGPQEIQAAATRLSRLWPNTPTSTTTPVLFQRDNIAAVRREGLGNLTLPAASRGVRSAESAPAATDPVAIVDRRPARRAPV
jgi:hypothetical protein